MDITTPGRRGLLAAGVAAALASPLGAAERPGKGPGQEKETPAVEDLMREHGVLRRALLVYAETAPRIAAGGRFDARPLNRAAAMFRSFGEDYHEDMLEEARIFPLIRQLKGPAAAYPAVLTAQHRRGRQVTEYILAVTRGGTVAASQAASLSRALQTFVVMYENHAAREDTVVFPAWKTALSQRQIDELGEEFEQIETKQFGRDGFEDALRTISQVEQAYGLTDLGRFTAPPPPRA